MDNQALILQLQNPAKHTQHEAAIHLIRRIEAMCVHHKTDADTILKLAENGLHSVVANTESSTNPADSIPTQSHDDFSPPTLGLELRFRNSWNFLQIL